MRSIFAGYNGQGRIRTSEGIQPADLQSAPFGHLGTYPVFKINTKPEKGIEPPTCCLQNSCSNRLSYSGLCCLRRDFTPFEGYVNINAIHGRHLNLIDTRKFLDLDFKMCKLSRHVAHNPKI